MLSTCALLSCARETEPPSDPTARTFGSVLRGTYEAHVPGSDLAEHDPNLKVWAGRFRLEILATRYILTGDRLGRLAGHFEAADEGKVRFRNKPAPTGPFNCDDAVGNRIPPDVPTPGRYEAALEGDALTLRLPGRDPCDLRGVILARTWTRLDQEQT